MIPTLLIVGLAVGIAVHDIASLRRSLLVGAGVSLLWGIVIGIGDRSLVTALGAALLGMANLMVGAALAAGTRTAIRSSSRKRHGSSVG